MAESKPFASLSSGLLARKGGAKPAMRPQGFTHFPQNANLEDLGWNDMGQFPEHVPTPIDALTPSPVRTLHEVTPESEAETEDEACFEDAPEPAVVEQQRALEETFAPEPEPEPEPVAEAEPEPAAEVVRLPERAPTPKRAPSAAPVAARAKAAFTLRLDPDRHLKLRLACALTRRSAQQLVTEALDEFLNSLPEVGALADRVPAEHQRSGSR